MKTDRNAPSSITLLDSRGGEVLLRIQSALDDFEIESAEKMHTVTEPIGSESIIGISHHWRKRCR